MRRGRQGGPDGQMVLFLANYVAYATTSLCVYVAAGALPVVEALVLLCTKSAEKNLP